MKHFVLLSILAMMLPGIGATQGVNTCAEGKQNMRYRPNAKGTLASPLLDDYDVKYVKLDLNMTNLSTTLSGNALTRAVVTNASGMAAYVFELNTTYLILDSVRVNGIIYTATMGNNLWTVTLPTAIPYGSLFTSQVFYHGTPPNGGGSLTSGMNSTTPALYRQTFSMSNFKNTKDWWPAKQSLLDKIDSADLWFTVPNGTMAGSNGLLRNVTAVGTSSRRYEWATRYPIDHYLISVAIAPYVDHRQVVHFTGSTDSMLIQHFIYDTATNYPLYLANVDSTAMMVDYFSTLYGRYPFWKEKYGHCLTRLSGGMEHQTMSTMGFLNTSLIAHELGHQWWGDHVTYASFADIWMSEGWATYSAMLFTEHFLGTAAFDNYRSTVFNNITGFPDGAVYVNDTNNYNRIYDSRLTYYKGAAVAHMLRYIAPADSVFFGGLRAYQQQYSFKNATTEDFKRVMATTYGRSLDTFFNEWVYGEGYPTYKARWNQRGNMVFIDLRQFPSTAITQVFKMPVVMKLNSTTGDTLVKVNFDTTQQIFSFVWPRQMVGMFIDPNNDILDKANVFDQVARDTTLFAANQGGPEERIVVYPNPSANGWQVKGLSQGSTLRLLDASGRLCWMKEDIKVLHLTINPPRLSPGIYTLSIQSKDGQTFNKIVYKL